MLAIPSVQQLKDRILSNLNAEFGITINPAIKAVFPVLSIVFANLLWLYYLAIGILQANLWVDTCDLKTLIRYGVIILGRNMFQATAARYTVTVTGTTGGIVPATAVFKSDDSSLNPGQLYQIVGGEYILPGSTGTITVVALTGGLGSKLNIGDTMTGTAPMFNVDATGTTATETVAPIDAETESEYRNAVIEKIQLQAGSWSAADYRLVGVDISGVAQTYAYLSMSDSNTVNVYLQGETPGTPISGGPIAAYATAIDLVRPIGTFVINTLASAIRQIDITITMGSFTPYTTDQKALILSALNDFINSVHPFIAACDTVSGRNDVVATFNLNVAISQAVPGFGFSSVTFTVDGTPSANWMADNGEIPYLNSITYA